VRARIEKEESLSNDSDQEEQLIIEDKKE